MITVPDLMRETRNYFPSAALDAFWTLHNGTLTPSGSLAAGSWVAVTGSFYNNGVYQLDGNAAILGAVDESWQGRIWLLAPPADFLALADQISAWAEQQGQGAAVKESFGAYSREVATGPDGRPLTWQVQFAEALRPYRRMYTEVKL